MELLQGSFGDAIRKARKGKQLTQEKLAELIGITPNHVKQLESERRNPSVKVLQKLVVTLDMSLDSLFSGSADSRQEIKNKINISLNRCSEHELEIVYAIIETLKKREH